MLIVLYMLIALAVLGLIAGIVSWWHYRHAPKEEPIVNPADMECCGQHEVCEKESLLAAVSKQIEYYDDEELDYKAVKVPFGAVGKAVAMGEPDGFCKLIIDNDTRTILGCHIMGAHASDLIQEVVTMMNLGVTIDDAKDIIHAHPTLNEIIQIAIHQSI